MKIPIENLESLYYFFQVDVGIFSMQKELFGIAELEIIGSIEGKENGRLEIACFFFKVLHVGCEHIGEILHDHRYVLKGLVLGFGVHH